MVSVTSYIRISFNDTKRSLSKSSKYFCEYYTNNATIFHIYVQQ